MLNENIVKITLSKARAHTAYVCLPGYEDRPGVVARTVCLDDAIDGFKGPRVHLDFNDDGVLIGIEVLV